MPASIDSYGCMATARPLHNALYTVMGWGNDGDRNRFHYQWRRQGWYQGCWHPSARHPAPARVQGARCHKLRLKNQAETRWAYHIEAASNRKETFDDIVDTVEQIRDSADSTGEQTQAAIGLLRSLTSFFVCLLADGYHRRPHAHQCAVQYAAVGEGNAVECHAACQDDHRRLSGPE